MNGPDDGRHKPVRRGFACRGGDGRAPALPPRRPSPCRWRRGGRSRAAPGRRRCAGRRWVKRRRRRQWRRRRYRLWLRRASAAAARRRRRCRFRPALRQGAGRARPGNPPCDRPPRSAPGRPSPQARGPAQGPQYRPAAAARRRDLPGHSADDPGGGMFVLRSKCTANPGSLKRLPAGGAYRGNAGCGGKPVVQVPRRALPPFPAAPGRWWRC